MDWADAREENDTLIIVTADHGQGFDVFGSVDTQFFNEDLAVLQQQLSEDYGITSTFTDAWKKRASIGMYESAGYPDYEDLDGDHFPDDWKVRTTFAADKAGHPDMTEDFQGTYSFFLSYRYISLFLSYRYIHLSFFLNGIYLSFFLNGIHISFFLTK